MIPKATQDKINKYRQKIKQNIINEQNNHIQTQMTPREQQITPRGGEYENSNKMQTTALSRSNIRRSQIEQDPSQIYAEQHQKAYIHRNKIFDGQQQQMPEQAKQEYQVKVLDPKTNRTAIIEQQRTAQKPSTSKSPSSRNPYMQEREAITKRKPTNSMIQNSSQGGGTNRNQYPNTANFHNLSSFDTFNNQRHLNSQSSVLPPLFSPISGSTNATQQVKILLEQNQILSLHLNQKMQRIRNLQNQLKEVAKNQILHEQKYDIEVSQLTAQNQMIKKSTDQQVKTLVLEVKKLNDQLIEKEQEWQQRLNKVRKVNLDQLQEMKKNHMLMQEKYKAELQKLHIQFSKINEEFKASKETSSATIENLRSEIFSLNQSLEKFNHIHKIEKSQMAVNHENAIREMKQEHFKKIEIINLDKIRRENQLQNTIDFLNKEISRLQNQLDTLKHEKQFFQVKQLQQRGKMMIELREEKQKIQHLKHQQNSKLQKISQTQLQTLINSYQSQVSELTNTISSLQSLLKTRGSEIQSLYKQISDTRTNYQQQLMKRQAHVQNLKQKMSQMAQSHIQEQECLKIKMAQLTQSNQVGMKQLYEKRIAEIKQLNLDKDEIIKSLREKVSNQFLELQENNLLHYQEIKQLETKIEKLEQQISSNALKERNTNVSMDKENIVLKENLLRQSEAYEKAANVKEQNIKRLQKIIETKDQQIQELQGKLQLLKKTHKQQLLLQKNQYETTIRERDDAIVGLKVELEYSRKEQSKKAEQFSHDKEYYSNQMKELKNKSEKDFNDWVENLSSEINSLKTQNKGLMYQLQLLRQEYSQYKKLWNQEETMAKMAEQEKQFIEKLSASFTGKYQKLMDSHEKDIEINYKPKIKNLNDLLAEKEQQINDMKINYHNLQVRFQKLMQDKETLSSLNDQVLTLGKSNNLLANHYVTLNK